MFFMSALFIFKLQWDVCLTEPVRCIVLSSAGFRQSINKLPITLVGVIHSTKHLQVNKDFFVCQWSLRYKLVLLIELCEPKALIVPDIVFC